MYPGRGSNAEGNFGTLIEARNFRGIKNRGTKRVNDELTQCAITHNIKKIHKHTTVNVLKTILNLIKTEKIKRKKVDINIIDELIKEFIFKDEILIDIKIK
ncbi:transposase [uncultured Methanobrevibacter sp.]|uniref:transposase n=1 Tax=uncultured Methanobrevibacter sp. TaxID=253161 RepID=UPI00344D3C2E